MDDNVFRINMDGTPFIAGAAPIPTVKTITLNSSVVPSMTHEELQAKKSAARDKQGRFAWSKLHAYLGCDPQWLEIWELLIPRYCKCQEGYTQFKTENPPDFSSPKAFWLWGVRLHNWVNAKLGKPLMTIQEAATMWDRRDCL